MTFEEILYKYKNSYYNFPQPLKKFLGSLYGNLPLSIRFGENFSNHTKILEKFENSNEQYKQDFMYNKTLETLIFAQEHVSYYKEKFQLYNVSYNDFKSLDDIKLFPLLSKEQIKKNLENIYTDKQEKAVAYYSGGSLSTPTKFFLPSSSRAKEKAYTNYIFSKINYKYRDRTLILKGREIADLEKNIFWDYDPIDNFFFISNNYMNSKYFPIIYKKALQFKPKFFFGYPSALLSFIKQAKKYNLKKINIEGIILASETVYTDELALIKEFFKVDILIHYGHTERNATGYKLNNNPYSFLNSYGLTRIVDNEIITTTFDNFVMPFINYKSGDHVTGDIIFYKNTDIAKNVENIEGRTQDFLVTNDKRLVSITTMCGGQYLPLEKMNAIQYIQNRIGEVTVLVEGNSEIDLNEVKSGMCKLVRDGINFQIKQVEHIEKSTRGKRVICKQSLDIEDIRKY